MRAARLRVLTYHRVLPRDVSCSPSTVSASPDVFEAQMRHLARAYRVVSSDEVIASLNAGAALPHRAVLITFDDGCLDFGTIAWPILRRYRLPATVFVPTAYPDHPERVFWWDRLHAALTASRRTTVEDPAFGVLPLNGPELREASLRRIQKTLKRI